MQTLWTYQDLPIIQLTGEHPKDRKKQMCVRDGRTLSMRFFQRGNTACALGPNCGLWMRLVSKRVLVDVCVPNGHCSWQNRPTNTDVFICIENTPLPLPSCTTLTPPPSSSRSCQTSFLHSTPPGLTWPGGASDNARRYFLYLCGR